MNTIPDLLDVETVLPYLRRRGLLDSTRAVPRLLGGGVSNVVIAVSSPTTSLVVKQSLPQLRVDALWEAPRERILTEAEGLVLCSRLTPGQVPEVISVDDSEFVLCLEQAPSDWVDWKQQLLAGQVSSEVATTLGQTLARWHSNTAGGRGLSSLMSDPETFEVLRVDPYLRTVIRGAPEVSASVQAVIDEMAAHRVCLVHGDFSPKNVLVAGTPPGVWVIDFEVAHLGDPAFDVAFLISHLVLKSLHRPQHATRLDEATTSFVEAYREVLELSTTRPESAVVRYVGALLLARVAGKSPVEYLDGASRRRAWDLGLKLVGSTNLTIREIPEQRRMCIT